MATKKTLICIHVMPSEIEMFERLMFQMHKSLSYLDENDEIEPINHYAEQKYLGEREVLAVYKELIITSLNTSSSSIKWSEGATTSVAKGFKSNIFAAAYAIQGAVFLRIGSVNT